MAISYDENADIAEMLAQGADSATTEELDMVEPVDTAETKTQEAESQDGIVNSEKITEKTGDKATKKDVTKQPSDKSLVTDATNKEKKEESQTAADKKDQASSKNVKKRASLGKAIGGLGGSQPLIKVNNYEFNSNELKYMRIETYGILPTIEVRVSIGGGKFMVRDFPKDGDVISVFIRSYTDLYHPISVDFLLTSTRTTRSKDQEGAVVGITFYGILNVNYIFAEQCKAIKEKTSFDALLEIATKLNIGFVSNIKSTNDKMTWLCAYQTYKEWIDNIAIHAWIDDKCFFDIWVDWYYKLNFAEMNRIYSVGDKEDAKDALMFSTYQKDHNIDDNTTSYKTKTILCNDTSYEKTNFYFDSLELIEDAGLINILNGYKRYVHFYDVGIKDDYRKTIKEKHSVIYVDSLITEGSEVYKHVGKGRAREDYYKDTNKNIWQGIQYSNKYKHNVHPYWKYAEYFNFQNLEHVEKLQLKLHLPKCNFNFHRGQRVEVLSLITRDAERARVGGHAVDDFKTHGFVTDRFISANNYVIVGINIIYEAISAGDSGSKGSSWGKFRQELLLGRREWELPNVTEKIDVSATES